MLGGGEHPIVEILLQIALQKHFSKLKQEGCIGDGAVGSRFVHVLLCVTFVQ